MRAIRRAADNLLRWPLVVCGDTPAAQASAVAVSARPPSNATSILARAGSPTSAAISAICGAFDILANMCEAARDYYQRCFVRDRSKSGAVLAGSPIFASKRGVTTV